MTPRRDRPAADPRHAAVKALLQRSWQQENPGTPDLPWGAAEAGCVGTFLRANPRVGVDVVQRCLDNRLASEDHAPAERIHRWFGDVLRYSQGPLDRYRLLKKASSEATLGMARARDLGEPSAGEEKYGSAARAWFVERAKQRHANHEKPTELDVSLLRGEGLL